MFDVWILTFERPVALTRLANELTRQSASTIDWNKRFLPFVNIFSNSPVVQLENEFIHPYKPNIVINSLNDRESNAWCARSWNSIFLKGFAHKDALVCIQDDTMIGPNFVKWLTEQSQKYDFISGPAGDQFFYIHKRVFQKVGWWDERFAGACYCGDADYFKRVYLEYDKKLVSMQDTHNWGWHHNPCGVMENIITTYESKTVDPDYDNQHWALERMLTQANPVLKYNQEWFKKKWGVDLDINSPAIHNGIFKLEKEINWYPAHTKKFGVTTYG